MEVRDGYDLIEHWMRLKRSSGGMLLNGEDVLAELERRLNDTALQRRIRQLEVALVELAIPLEVLNADNHAGATWMAPELRQDITKACATARRLVTYTSTAALEYGIIDTVEEFLSLVASGGISDDDGYGHPVLDGFEAPSICIRPSTCPQCIPPEATHVAWYNH